MRKIQAKSKISQIVRQMDKLSTNSFMIITAFRYKDKKGNILSLKQNKERNKELKGKIRALGFGFVPVAGTWLECTEINSDGTPMDYDTCPENKKVQVSEKSFFVMDIALKEAYKLMRRYNQDSIVFGESDSVFLVFKNRRKVRIGNSLSLSNIQDAWTQLDDGRKISFGEVSKISKKKDNEAKESRNKMNVGEKLNSKAMSTSMKLLAQADKLLAASKGSVFLGSWASPAEGKWITDPTEDKIRKEIKAAGIDSWIISDYDGYPDLGENPDLKSFDNVTEAMEEYGSDTVTAVFNEISRPKDAIEFLENSIMYSSDPFDNFEEVHFGAQEFLEKNELHHYFDYVTWWESFLINSGTYIEVKDGVLVS